MYQNSVRMPKQKIFLKTSVLVSNWLTIISRCCFTGTHVYPECKYLLQESENKCIEFHQTLGKDIFTIQPQNQVTEGLCH